MNLELNIGSVMKRIDVYGRLAFGGQCIAAMAILAAPALFIAAAVVPLAMEAGDVDVGFSGRLEELVLWLGGWLVSAGLMIGGVAFAVFCWRWSGDWITEWPGYAAGFAIAAVANALLAWLLTSTKLPMYLSFVIAMSGAFATGVLVAGNLAGTRVLPATRQAKPAPLLRRR